MLIIGGKLSILCVNHSVNFFESSGYFLDLAKTLKEKIDRVANNLEKDFSDKELEEIFEDADEMWIAGFTDNYLADILKMTSFHKN